MLSKVLARGGWWHAASGLWVITWGSCWLCPRVPMRGVIACSSGSGWASSTLGAVLLLSELC